MWFTSPSLYPRNNESQPASEYSLTVACGVLGCARSGYYHQASERLGEAELKYAVKQVRLFRACSAQILPD